MRTTLDIDDDILNAARELARRQRRSAGQVISQLARQSLTGVAEVPAKSRRGKGTPVAGFRPFPAREAVTNEHIDVLRDSEGI